MNPYFNTFLETERVLLTAFELSNNSVKSIAGATGINSSTLYKWKTTDVHLSPSKADALVNYFIENEPVVLVKASLANSLTDILLDTLSSSSEKEVVQEDENNGKQCE